MTYAHCYIFQQPFVISNLAFMGRNFRIRHWILLCENSGILLFYFILQQILLNN